MFGSDILEVISGVVFLFILIATLCSAIREGIEAWMRTRAAYLEHGLRELLQDKDGTGIVSDLFNHPMIFGLFSGDYSPGKAKIKPRPWHGGANLPTYIPSRNFALALMDLAANGPPPTSTPPATGKPAAPAPSPGAAAGAPPATAPAAGAATPAGGTPLVLSMDKIRANIHRIGNPAVQRALLAAVDTSAGDLDRVRENIEAWYNSAMDRISGWYRRSTHWIILLIASVVTVGLNINTLTICDYLYTHPAQRNVIVSTAEHAAATDQTNAYKTAQQELTDLTLPIGWSRSTSAPQTTPVATPFSQASFNLWAELRSLVPVITSPWRDLFQPLIGWAITAFAATLGAPFWFDVLSKVMTARSTIKSQ